MVRLVIFNLVGTVCDHGATFARRALVKALRAPVNGEPTARSTMMAASLATPSDAPSVAPATPSIFLGSDYDPSLATDILTREDVQRVVSSPSRHASSGVVPQRPLTPSQLTDLYRRYRHEHRALLARDPHVLHSQIPRVFQDLRGLGVMIGAVGPYPRTWYRVVQRHAFQRGMGFGVTGWYDPDVADSPLVQALTTARQGDPTASYFVGDNVNALQEAKRHGLRTIAVIDSSRYMGSTEEAFARAMYDEVEQRRDAIVDEYLTGKVGDIIVPNIACVPLVLRAAMAMERQRGR